jgi:hypothetical protein
MSKVFIMFIISEDNTKDMKDAQSVTAAAYLRPVSHA